MDAQIKKIVDKINSVGPENQSAHFGDGTNVFYFGVDGLNCIGINGVGKDERICFSFSHTDEHEENIDAAEQANTAPLTIVVDDFDAAIHFLLAMTECGKRLVRDRDPLGAFIAELASC